MSVILKSPLSVITVISVTTGDFRSPLESPLYHHYITEITDFWISESIRTLFLSDRKPFVGIEAESREGFRFS